MEFNKIRNILNYLNNYMNFTDKGTDLYSVGQHFITKNIIASLAISITNN